MSWNVKPEGTALHFYNLLKMIVSIGGAVMRKTIMTGIVLAGALICTYDTEVLASANDSTVAIVVDDSGCYVSGSKCGQPDEDFVATTVTDSKYEHGTNKKSLFSSVDILSFIDSSVVKKILLFAGFSCIVVSFTLLGIQKGNRNVRYS